jgi:hypothetical protein
LPTNTNIILLVQDPNTKAGAQIGQELGQDGGVQVAALLEKALHQRDVARAMKEDKKDKANKVRVWYSGYIFTIL